MALYDFSVTETYDKSLQVDDAANCCIRARDAEGLEYYLRIKTVMGMTSLFEVGPVLADMPILADGFHVNYQHTKYSDKKIDKWVDSFLNNPKFGLTEAEEVIESEMWSVLPNLEECFERGDD